MASREIITHLLNNQPNGVRIGCSRFSSEDIVNTPFHHLSRLQQIEQVNDMLLSGIDISDLRIDLYLVSHQPTFRVWETFGLPMLTTEDLDEFYLFSDSDNDSIATDITEE